MNVKARRRIAVLTGGRAEYGLLRPLLQHLYRHPDADIGLFVTGMHLSVEFGNSIDEIEMDGIPVWERIDSLLASDSPEAVCSSMALTCIGVSKALAHEKPDILVLLGDRYELFAAAQSAMIHRIPIAHIHGGEATEGLIDEAIRHAVTKMSHLHFASTETYRDRIIQMGEAPEHVFNSGALGVDNITGLSSIPAAELEKDLGLNLAKPTFLITYHPVTLAARRPTYAVRELLAALAEHDEANFVFTYPNADTYGRDIIEPVRKFVTDRPSQAVFVESLGVRRYLSLMKHAVAVVGNSSSGIIEAPSLGIPTIDIGMRQQGRVRATSVIHCTEDQSAISRAISRACSPEFQREAQSTVNPYGNGGAAEFITQKLLEVDLNGIILKSFHDIGMSK